MRSAASVASTRRFFARKKAAKLPDWATRDAFYRQELGAWEAARGYAYSQDEWARESKRLREKHKV